MKSERWLARFCRKILGPRSPRRPLSATQNSAKVLKLLVLPIVRCFLPCTEVEEGGRRHDRSQFWYSVLTKGWSRHCGLFNPSRSYYEAILAGIFGIVQPRSWATRRMRSRSCGHLVVEECFISFSIVIRPFWSQIVQRAIASRVFFWLALTSWASIAREVYCKTPPKC